MTTVYRYSEDGWQVSSLDEAADASYSIGLRSSSPAPDLAVAARAVVCMALRL
jgi:hypothetical protein